MTYEVQFNTGLGGSVTYSEPVVWTTPRTYMGKRFKRPKKFVNNDSPNNPGGTSTAVYTFN